MVEIDVANQETGRYVTSGAGVAKQDNEHSGTGLVTNGLFYFEKHTKAQPAVKSPFATPSMSDWQVLF